ncbi:MAG: hypothetical protein HYY37_06785 [Candidatus Aenigmarchaeota archaeon]|nr:hypothetical protein [Candidatus Aenigmarchaeota archaeon]
MKRRAAIEESACDHPFVYVNGSATDGGYRDAHCTACGGGYPFSASRTMNGVRYDGTALKLRVRGRKDDEQYPLFVRADVMERVAEAVGT